MGAEVPVLAPVAAEGAVHTGQAPGDKGGVSTGLSTVISRLPGKIKFFEGGGFDKAKVRNGFGETHRLKRQTSGSLTIYSTVKYKLGFIAHRWAGVK